MQPILATKCEYVQKKIGVGKPGNVCLYQDRIIVYDKSNNVRATIMLAEISAAQTAMGVLRFMVGEQLHCVTFFRLPYRFFGLLGYVLSGAGASTKLWVNQLSQTGLQFQKKLF